MCLRSEIVKRRLSPRTVPQINKSTGTQMLLLETETYFEAKCKFFYKNNIAILERHCTDCVERVMFSLIDSVFPWAVCVPLKIP